MFVPAIGMQRGTNAEKELKRVPKISSVVTIETLRTIIDCELGTESDIETIAMRQIAYITDRSQGERQPG